MVIRTSQKRRRLACFAAAAAMIVAVDLPFGTAAAQAGDLQQSGTISVSQTQIAFIGSGNLGGHFQCVGRKFVSAWIAPILSGAPEHGAAPAAESQPR